KPDGLLDAKIIVEDLFEAAARLGFIAEAGIALLDFGEQALLSGDEDSGAVDIDGATFEDNAVRLVVRKPDLRLDLRQVVMTDDVVRDHVVPFVVGILGPGVELPICDGEVVAVALLNEDRAGVAQPDAVGGP